MHGLQQDREARFFKVVYGKKSRNSQVICREKIRVYKVIYHN